MYMYIHVQDLAVCNFLWMECVGETEFFLDSGWCLIFIKGADEIDLHASSKTVKETQQEVEQLRGHFAAKVTCACS